MKIFSSCGCVVYPIADPTHHHHSKRASIRRRTEKNLKNVNTTSARHELTQISQNLNMGSFSGNEKESMMKEKERLKKITKKGMHPEYGSMMDNTMSMLSQSIEEGNLSSPNESGGSMCNVKLVFHKAEVLFAKRSIERKSSIMLSSDSDFCMHIRSGELMLKEFKCDSKKNLINDMLLGFSDKTLATKVHDDLKKFGNCEAKLTAECFDFSKTLIIGKQGFDSPFHG